VFPVLGWLLLALVSFYLVVIIAGSLHAASRAHELKLALYLPAIFVVIHFCWGTGFVVGLASPQSQKSDLDRVSTTSR